jgi:hypothetical protein
MARRNIQVFNMSFLDLMTDALGAVMILFLITPKGQSFRGLVEGKAPQGVVRFDTVAKKLWGDIAWGNVDSLRHKKGDTLAIVVGSFERMPLPKMEEHTTSDGNNAYIASDEMKIKKKDYEAAFKNSGVKIPDNMQLVPKTANILADYQVAVDKAKLAKMKEVNADEEVVKKSTRSYGGGGGTEKNGKMLCIGDAAFQIAWDDNSDNLDIFVKNNAGGEVSFKRRSHPNVGKMVNLTSIFGQGFNIKNTEVVSQAKIIPGSYTISAAVYKSAKPSVTLFATVATKKTGRGFAGVEVPADKQPHIIGQITIDAAGNIQ